MAYCDGITFEKEVADLLSLMGYRVVRDSLLGGKQVDILAEFVAPGGIAIRMIVECKFKSNGTVGNTEVYELGALYHAVKDTERLDSAILISNVGFSRFAKDAGKSTGIRLRTYDELFQNVADFRPYLQALVQEYEESPIYGAYIRLRYCTPRRLKQLENISDPHKRKLKSSTYEDIVDEYLDSWLERNTKYEILILGDYGIGKTTICRHFSYILAKRYLEHGSPNRIPLPVTLRDYARGPGARQLMTDFLVNKCGIQINYEVFKRLNRSAKFILVLDGFDEMSTRVDASIAAETIQNLNELIVPGSKVILTGRLGYFPSQQALESLFRSSKPEDPYEKVYLEDIEEGIPYFKHLYILPLSHAQVLEFLEKRSDDLWSMGRVTCDEIMTTIENTYNLEDLAERPVLLDLIIKTVPKLSAQLDHINAQKLYAIYTDFWIVREESKGRKLIGRQDKVLFMKELAFQMYYDDRLTIHYRDLSPKIKQYFNIKESDTLDHFAYDIRMCSFLDRDSSGNYFFAHKSFMEFFVAMKLIDEIRNKKNWNFGRRPLTKEVTMFILQAFDKEEEKILLKWFSSSGTVSEQGGSFTSANALRLLLLSGHDFNAVVMSHKNLANLDLQGVSFVGADLRGCNLSGCNLAKANLQDTQLETANLSAAVLKSANLSKATLYRATLVHADVEDCDLEHADLTEANLSNIKGWEKIGSFKETKLSDATGLQYEEAEHAKLRGAIGKPCLSQIELERERMTRRKEKQSQKRARERKGKEKEIRKAIEGENRARL